MKEAYTLAEEKAEADYNAFKATREKEAIQAVKKADKKPIRQDRPHPDMFHIDELENDEPLIITTEEIGLKGVLVQTTNREIKEVIAKYEGYFKDKLKDTQKNLPCETQH